MIARERVEALGPLIRLAYDSYGTMDFGRAYPMPKKFPDKRADQDRLRASITRWLVEETSIALRVGDPGERWSDQDIADAVAVVERLRNLAGDGYESGMTREQLAAKIPGVDRGLCDAYLGYLGATRH